MTKICYFANQVNNAVVFLRFCDRYRILESKLWVKICLYRLRVRSNIVDSDHLKNDYNLPKVNDPRIINIVTVTLKAKNRLFNRSIIIAN